MPDLGAFRALGHRNYRLFWIGGFVSNTGRWFQVLAIPAIVWQLTENAGWVGFAGFASMAPMALMGPIAGVLADRFDRRRLLLVTQSLQAAATAGLMIMWMVGVRSAPAFIALSAVAGLCAGLNLPAWQAYVSELVPRDLILNAVTLNSLQFNSARMLGPVLAGVLLAEAGPAWAFFVNFVSYGAVLIALALIDTRSPLPDRLPDFRPVRDFLDTVGYVRTQPGLSSAISMVAVLALCGMPIQVLSVVFAEEVFDRGEAGFGIMLTMIGLGAVLAGPLVAGLGDRIARSRLVPLALGGYATGVMAFSQAPRYSIALVCLMGLGACHLTTASLLNTTVQLQVDESRRAKVLSIYVMTFTIFSPIGQLVLGQLIEVFGPRPTIFGAGATMMSLAGLLYVSGRFATLDGDSEIIDDRLPASPRVAGSAPAT